MIGIITRQDVTPTNRDVYVAYKAINDIINDFNEIGIGILPNNIDNLKKIINKCDGIILEGGNDFTSLDLDIIKYIYDKDIPCLGICLGMQSMAYLFNGDIGTLKDNRHNSNNQYVHEVITSNSKIYGNRVIKVNSRHKDYVIDTDLEVTGKSIDNIIEMVEDKDKTFFVGVEWHPENMYKTDLDAYLLFNQFFNVIKQKNIL